MKSYPVRRIFSTYEDITIIITLLSRSMSYILIVKAWRGVFEAFLNGSIRHGGHGRRFDKRSICFVFGFTYKDLLDSHNKQINTNL